MGLRFTMHRSSGDRGQLGRLPLALLLLGIAACGRQPSPASPDAAALVGIAEFDSFTACARVTVESGPLGWRLLRNGEPYYIKGAGADTFLRSLKRAGANSIRIWGAEQADRYLDEARNLGMTVTLGIWLGHREHGFDYHDTRQVAAQFAEAEKFVEKYRFHPALLIWGIGNEMEMEIDTDPLVWQAVNDIAHMVHERDTFHPTMTVTADLRGIKLAMIKWHCPDIDILGVNTYGGLRSLAKRLRIYQWNKPYIVTEFGPDGTWEARKTAWRTEYEPNSTEKAEQYLQRYQSAIAADSVHCLGSYVFFWGPAQDYLSLWYNFFLPDYHKVGAVDAMTMAWTGQWPKNRCPLIRRATFTATGDSVPPGTVLSASLDLVDPDNDTMTVLWTVISDNPATRPQVHPLVIPSEPWECNLQPSGYNLSLLAPPKPGPYRLWAYVRDAHGNGAYANFPFLVK